MGSKAEELRRRVLDLFADSLESDKAILALWDAIYGGKSASYADAYNFSVRVGEKLSAAFQAVQSELPDRIEEDFANVFLRDALKGDYEVVSNAAEAVQQALNERAGLGLKAQAAPLNTDRAEGLAKKFASYGKTEAALWLLGEPIINFSQSVVDETVEKNADFQSRAGLRPRIIRKLAGKGCKWCRDLAGVYDYPDVPRDVYRRHENCRCTVEYDPGSGKRVQDVWTKRWTRAEESDKIEKRKQVGMMVGAQSSKTPEQIVSAVSKCDIPDTKIMDYLLKPGARHSGDFFDVGYTQNNSDMLLKDLQRAFDKGLRVEIQEGKYKGDIRFNIYSMLGVTAKKRFCTGWYIDSGSNFARFVTAFRKDV